MKKKVGWIGAVIAGVLMVGSMSGTVTAAISEKQEAAIVDYCNEIQTTLKGVQKQDARTRVYLGSYYETILTKFITKLSLRLVENNLSRTELIENQAKFAEAREKFNADFIEYQKNLEELVGKDCRAEPEKFYEDLVLTREGREKVKADVKKMSELAAEHVKLVKALKADLEEGE